MGDKPLAPPTFLLTPGEDPGEDPTAFFRRESSPRTGGVFSLTPLAGFAPPRCARPGGRGKLGPASACFARSVKFSDTRSPRKIRAPFSITS